MGDGFIVSGRVLKFRSEQLILVGIFSEIIGRGVATCLTKPLPCKWKGESVNMFGMVA